MIVIEGVRATDKVFDLFNPGWMVDQPFECFAAFVNLLQIQAVLVTEVMAMNVALPFAGLHRQQRVDGGVDIADLLP